jgi:PKD repeat protein
MASLFLVASVAPVLGGLSLPAQAAASPVPHVGGDSGGFGQPGSASWDAYTVPDYQGILGQLGLWAGAAEPSGGICWATSDANPDGQDILYFKTATGVGRATFDDAATPATAAWTDVSRVLVPEAHHAFADPILHTDEKTCRTWAGHMEFPSPCTTDIAFRDDDPAALPPANPVDGWTVSAFCQPSAADHETIGSGPYSQDLPVAPDVAYPHIVYYCAQYPSINGCVESYDGGVTWLVQQPGSDQTRQVAQCGGIFGHLKVSPEGYAAIPHRACLNSAGIELSRNNGLTWSAIDIPGIPATGHFDPSLAWSRGAQPGGNSWLYFGNGLNGGLYASVSPDFGVHWQSTGRISDAYTGPNGERITRAEFANVEAGDWDRAAISFLGTTDTGGADAWTCTTDPSVVWYMYVARTYDAGQTWKVERASGDPVQVGGLWPSGGTSPCRNLLDFNDLDLGSDGRLYVSFADGCLAPQCHDGAATSTSTAAQGTVIRQSSGCGLLASADRPGSDCVNGVGTGDGTPVVRIGSPAGGASVAQGTITVSGTVNRAAPPPPLPLSADAQGPYSGAAGSPIAISGAHAGGRAPYACSWSGAGATFGSASACDTTVTYASADGSPYTLTLTLTDADGAATDTATVAVAAPGGSVSATDSDSDAKTQFTELTGFEAHTAGGKLVATLSVKSVWPSTAALSPVSYSLVVNGNGFDSFPRYPTDANPMTWDTGAGAYLPSGSSSWDTTANTVTFLLPLDYLASHNLGAPWSLHATSNEGALTTAAVDDTVPDAGGPTLPAVHPGTGGLLPTLPASPASDQATDPTGDSKLPGTDITGAWVHDETATTFQVSLRVDDLPSAVATSVNALGVPTGVSTEYTVSFQYDESASNAVTYQVQAANHAVSVPEPGPPAADGHTYALQVVGAGTTNFVTTVGDVPGTWGGSDGKTVTWTVAKADMVVKTAPTGATDAGVLTGGSAPAPGGTLHGFTAETRSWVYAGVGAGPAATVWDTAGPSGAYTFAGGANAAPTAAFSCAAAGLALSCDAGASSDDVGISSYAWDFGDGATATGVTASHTYASAGTQTVGLTVTDGAGATGTASRGYELAADSGGEKVNLLVDGVRLGVAPVASTTPGDHAWSGALDLSGVAAGDHTLAARWVDADGTPLASAEIPLHVTAGSTGTTTGTATDTGSAGGSVNNVAPGLDKLAATPSIAVIGRDQQVAIAGAAHDDNGNQDIVGVTVTVADPLGATANPAATLANDASDATAVSFAASSAVDSTTLTGTYQVDTFATDADGAQSPVVSVTFTVLPPPAVEVGYTGAASRLDFGSFDPGATQVQSQNAFSVTNSLHEDKDFLFDMTDFTCTHGSIPVMGNAKVLLGSVDGAGVFTASATKDYTQSTVDFGTISDGTSLFVKLELQQVPLAIAGTCTASFGLYHT